MKKFAERDKNPINFFVRRTQFFYCFCSLNIVVFCRRNSFEMVLLTYSRIFFWWVSLPSKRLLGLDPLVIELVVSSTHDYATFSLDGLDEYISLLYSIITTFCVYKQSVYTFDSFKNLS